MAGKLAVSPFFVTKKFFKKIFKKGLSFRISFRYTLCKARDK